jgi:acetyl esterase/lipase
MMKSVLDIEYKNGLYIDLFLPEKENFDVFVYFHGGGICSGDRKGKEVGILANTLTKKGIAVASVEYSMYPTAKFPDFIEDGADAVAWIKNNISSYGGKGVFVGGSSAGGYISMMLCFNGEYLNKRGLKPTDIDGYVHDAGQPTSHFNVLKELGKDSRRIIVDETAPMYFVGTANEYAPMVFIVADDDMFGRYEQTMLMLSVMKHFGHQDKIFFKQMHGKHCSYDFTFDEDGEGTLGNIVAEFIEKII